MFLNKLNAIDIARAARVGFLGEIIAAKANLADELNKLEQWHQSIKNLGVREASSCPLKNSSKIAPSYKAKIKKELTQIRYDIFEGNCTGFSSKISATSALMLAAFLTFILLMFFGRLESENGFFGYFTMENGWRLGGIAFCMLGILGVFLQKCIFNISPESRCKQLQQLEKLKQITDPERNLADARWILLSDQLSLQYKDGKLQEHFKQCHSWYLFSMLVFVAFWLGDVGAGILSLLPEVFGCLVIVCILLIATSMVFESGVIQSIEDRAEIYFHNTSKELIETQIAHIMTMNADLVIGNLNKKSREPGKFRPIPEADIRTLDEEFQIKEAINSFESPLRARLRHVGSELSKLEEQRKESYAKAQRGLLGMGACFIVFEIGERVQNLRDLNKGSDQKSFLVWKDKYIAETYGLKQVTPAQAAAASKVEPCEKTPSASSARTEACLQAWLQDEQQSSYELVIVAIIVAIIMVLKHHFKAEEISAPAASNQKTD